MQLGHDRRRHHVGRAKLLEPLGRQRNERAALLDLRVGVGVVESDADDAEEVIRIPS